MMLISLMITSRHAAIVFAAYFAADTMMLRHTPPLLDCFMPHAFSCFFRRHFDAATLAGLLLF